MKNNPLVYERNRSGKGIIRVVSFIIVLPFFLYIVCQISSDLARGDNGIAIVDIILALLLFWALHVILRGNGNPSVQHLGKIVPYNKLKKHLKTQDFKVIYTQKKVALLESDLWVIIRLGISSYFIPKNMIVGTYIDYTPNMKASGYIFAVALINGNALLLYMGGVRAEAEMLEKSVYPYIPHPHETMSLLNDAEMTHENWLYHWWHDNRNLCKEKWKEYRKSNPDGFSAIENYVSL